MSSQCTSALPLYAPQPKSKTALIMSDLPHSGNCLKNTTNGHHKMAPIPIYSSKVEKLDKPNLPLKWYLKVTQSILICQHKYGVRSKNAIPIARYNVHSLRRCQLPTASAKINRIPWNFEYPNTAIHAPKTIAFTGFLELDHFLNE